MSRILVTGGAGFIGSALVETLLEKGHKVRVLDSLTTGKESNLSGIKNRIEFIRGDIRDLEAVKKAMEGIEYVFHLAAFVSVPESVKNPQEANAVNIDGTLNILTAAKDAGVKRLVFSSSCAVYGEKEKPVSESDTVNPQSPYAMTKLVGEKYCGLFQKLYGLETAILRYFNVYGPRQNPESDYAAVIPKFITQIMEGKPSVIYGTGGQTRDFVFVKDVANANLLAMEKPEAAGQTFNIGTGKAESINTLFETIKNILGGNEEPSHSPGRAGDIHDSAADISRAKKILGYSPEYALEDGLKETIKWFSG